MRRSLLRSMFGMLSILTVAANWAVAAGQPVTLRVSLGIPEHQFVARQYTTWAKLVEQNSKGEIKPQVYYSAQLYRDNEVVKAIQSGAVEAGYALSFVLENQLVPSMKVLQMPFLFRSLDEAIRVLRSDIGDAMERTAEQKGVKLLAIVSYPSPEGEGIMTTKAVKVPADLKGMVLRSSGPETAAMMRKWGAGPSFLTGAEVYLGIQRNTIQGSVISIPVMVERKHYEVAKYVVMVPSATVHSFIAINKGFFDGLTPFQQKAILDASAVVEKESPGIAMATLNKDMEELKKKATVYYPTAPEMDLWRSGCEEVWAESAKTNKDAADTLAKVRAMLKR